jgi:hypothetical protein
MKTKEIEEIVNDKILRLFYKLLNLNPIKISNSSFYYDLNGEIFELGISQFSNKNENKYKLPELHKNPFNVAYLSSFTVNDKWSFYINLPKGICDKETYNYRQLPVPISDDLELLKIKQTLLIKQQHYELTLLDKYLIEIDEAI